MVGFICCIATVPFEALCCAVVWAVLRVVFSVPYVCMLFHCMCMLLLSVCVVLLPHYCVLLTLSVLALLEKVSGGSVVGWGWVIVPQLVGCWWGGWDFGLLLLGF